MSDDDKATALPSVTMRAATPVKARSLGAAAAMNGGDGERVNDPAPDALWSEVTGNAPRAKHKRMTPAEKRAVKAQAARDRRARERGEAPRDVAAISAAVVKIGEALKPLSGDDRKRAMDMVALMLG